MIWFGRVFSGAADIGRVNPIGLILLCAGAAAVLLAGRTAASEKMKNTIKITGLIISAGGALLAILG